MAQQWDEAMEKRKIAKGIEKRPYFEAVTVVPVPEQDDGTRELGELYPFLISGGTNTERYYFTHINDTTDYKFNIRPRYFGDEATIVATLVNFRSEDIYTIYWQYCTDATLDEPDWITIEGENSRLYSFIVDRDNYQYGYRVLIQMED